MLMLEWCTNMSAKRLDVIPIITSVTLLVRWQNAFTCMYNPVPYDCIIKIVHNSKPLTRQLLQNTTVLFRGHSKNDLAIAEALLIKKERPSLNLQDEGQVRVLKIF